MRSLALFGSFLLVTGLQAQSLAEHAAAASGATIGTAAGKPLSNAITKIFGQTDASAKKAATAPVITKSPDRPEAEFAAPVQLAPQGGGGELPSLGGGSAPTRHGGFSARRSAREYAAITPTAPISVYVPEPVRPEPTAEEFATIMVGASGQELITKLGQPESKVTIPGDDGHLLEICQYWSKGKQLGTVRLDNGLVVNVESRTQE
jgi:hypothetical protein